jgi:hypothetical protein
MKARFIFLPLLAVVAGIASVQTLRSQPDHRAASAPSATSPGLALPAPPVPSAADREAEGRVPARTTMVTRQPPVPVLLPTRIATEKPDTARTESAPPEATMPGLTEVAARTAIEADGYKNVRVVSMAPDGTWRARALRGQTEVVLRVDATGRVSAD